jgi:translation initiation factor IF-2
LNVAPSAGDNFCVTTSEDFDARQLTEARSRLSKQALETQSSSSILASANSFASGQGSQQGEVRQCFQRIILPFINQRIIYCCMFSLDFLQEIKIPVLIKADSAGSVDVLRQSLEAIIEQDQDTVCKIDVVYSGIGDVTSSDVGVALAAKARIVAFNVAADNNAIEYSKASNVAVNYYTVIYSILDELQDLVRKTLSPPPPGTLLGRATIKKIFRIGKSGKVAGCAVTEGSLALQSKVRLLRGKRNEIYSGSISSLKVVKDEVQEVPMGSECGLAFENFAGFEEGDIIECFVAVDKS